VDNEEAPKIPPDSYITSTFDPALFDKVLELVDDNYTNLQSQMQLIENGYDSLKLNNMKNTTERTLKKKL